MLVEDNRIDADDHFLFISKTSLFTLAQNIHKHCDIR